MQKAHLQCAGEQPTCRLVRRSTAVKVPVPATLPNVMDTNPPAVGRYPWILATMGPAGWHSTCAWDIECSGEQAEAMYRRLKASSGYAMGRTCCHWTDTLPGVPFVMLQVDTGHTQEPCELIRGALGGHCCLSLSVCADTPLQ